ncbi:hypothetical protein BH09VER1_BH09VER1_48240 [soil metagenome]
MSQGASLLLVVLLIGAVVTAGALAVSGRRVPPGAKTIYWIAVMVLALAAYLLTFHFEYEPSENKLVRGWPVPHVVFEHPEAAVHGEDYIGAISHAAYPLNLALFLLVPAVGLFVWRWRPARGMTRVSLF